MAADTPGAGLSLTDAQRLDWLRLIRSENVGPRTFRSLLNHFGGARAALDALPELARRGGARTAIKVCPAFEAERELDELKLRNISLIALGEADYPAPLRAIDDAPPLLAVRGRPDVLAMPTVAIVGSRNASAVGLKFTERLAKDLGDAGFVVVSGLARGIDASAHRFSLRSGTVAVLAGGHDRIYPPEHIDLLRDIVVDGAAISEMPLFWEPRARDFPRRNRLISGLSLGVVIVEAAKRSGSLITARMALEQGREVFAVPGSPLDPRADGTNGLIKQGATLVTSADDVVAVLRPMLGKTFEDGFQTEEADMEGGPGAPDRFDAADGDAQLRARIISLLGPTPVSLDDLIRLSGASAGAVRVTLLELEIAGRLERSAGGMVALRM